ncbi:MAG: hypothetical protein ABSC49_03730 [Candidatus Microgenomates bacterium]|jgi:uncharacterized protein YbcI
MTLTKDDLNQIGKIVRSETRKIVLSETPEIVRSETIKIVQSETPKIVQSETGKIIKPLKSDISKIRKDVDTMLSMFDREYVDLRKRVERIEEHLGFNQN